MSNQIFVGGWENTGTRLISIILNKFGYDNFYNTHTNKYYDFLGGRFLKIFKKYYNNKTDIIPFSSIVKNTTKNSQKWIIKHGHTVFMFKDLKQQFNCKTILLIREPYDSLIKSSHNYKLLEGYSINPSIDKKFNHYKKWYSNENLKYTDYIIKMEELVFSPKETICKLLEFLNITPDINILNDCIKIIKPSNSINYGKNNIGNIDIDLKYQIDLFRKKFNYID